jgi:hypothetical protein
MSLLTCKVKERSMCRKQNHGADELRCLLCGRVFEVSFRDLLPDATCTDWTLKANVLPERTGKRRLERLTDRSCFGSKAYGRRY